MSQKTARVVTPIVILLLFCFCGAPQQISGAETSYPRSEEKQENGSLKKSGKWIGGVAGQSKMDDSQTVGFILTAENEIQLWLKSHRPSLIVVCAEDKTRVIVVTGGAADPELGVYGKHTVEIRFDKDQKIVQEWTASTSDDQLSSPRPISFSRRIAQSKTMLFRFTAFKKGSRTIEFDVRGFANLIGDVAKTCHWQP